MQISQTGEMYAFQNIAQHPVPPLKQQISLTWTCLIMHYLLKCLKCFSFTGAAVQRHAQNHNISELSNRSTNVLQHNQELHKNAHSTHSVLCWDMTHKNYISTRFTHNHGLNFPPRPSMTLPSSSKTSSASSRITSFMSFSVMSGKAIPSYPLLLFSFA